MKANKLKDKLGNLNPIFVAKIIVPVFIGAFVAFIQLKELTIGFLICLFIWILYSVLYYLNKKITKSYEEENLMLKEQLEDEIKKSCNQEERIDDLEKLIRKNNINGEDNLYKDLKEFVDETDDVVAIHIHKFKINKIGNKKVIRINRYMEANSELIDINSFSQSNMFFDSKYFDELISLTEVFYNEGKSDKLLNEIKDFALKIDNESIEGSEIMLTLLSLLECGFELDKERLINNTKYIKTSIIGALILRNEIHCEYCGDNPNKQGRAYISFFHHSSRYGNKIVTIITSNNTNNDLCNLYLDKFI